MRRSIQLAIAAILAVAILASAGSESDVLARGFGGFHGGGFGGYHAGGFGGYRGFDSGGYRAGGFDDSGFRAGGIDSSGLRTGGFDSGVLGGGFRSDYGGSLNRGEMNSFLGLPTDGGMHAAGGAFGASGHVVEGPGGTTVAHGTAGVHGFAAGPGGIAAGGRAVSGTAVKGPNGNVYTHTTSASRGVAAGTGGIVAGHSVLSGHGFVGADGTHYFSPTYFHAQSVAANRWCAASGIWGTGWVAHHPWAWYPGGWAAAAWGTAIWQWATWPTIGTWLAYDATPDIYTYGDYITYQDGYVYYGGQQVETEQNYYDQAQNLAGTVGGAAPPADAQWLPLGVFGLMPIGEKTPIMVFQLAVDKAGEIRGNCYVPSDGANVAVQGAVAKNDQRVAWQIAGNQSMVIETGLYNLTHKQSTALVHYDASDTVTMVLARIDQPQSGEQQPPQD